MAKLLHSLTGNTKITQKLFKNTILCKDTRFLGSQMPDSKNVLKKLDYNCLKIEEVNYLPPRFDGPCMFVLPLVGASSSQAKAKSIEGMDKRYDGHV